jgi:Tfp pilus assembly protein PilF
MKVMATNRLELLKQMVAQDPKNGFARYGLAIEYANSGDLAQAVSEFKGLLEQDENYTAAYFHSGQALEKLGRIDEARVVYESGIQATTRTGDHHTRSEIEAALRSLPR